MSDIYRARLRLAFYGDDFTGSSDALEVLAFAGLRCALFLKVPTSAMLDALGGFDAVGVAGDSRGMSPQEMDQVLPDVLRAMQALEAPVLHYKVCSTFDSSPAIGSIGHVLDIARTHLASSSIPIVAGTPALQRYCTFGNLFARAGTDGKMYRIDRHPIMSMHPVTPMHEGDLVRHLGQQTDAAIVNFSLPQFDQERPGMDEAHARLLAGQPAAVLFDTASSRHLTEVGRLIEAQACSNGQLFAIGSSGLEYALTQWWAASGQIAPPSRSFDKFDRAARILAISGSASPLSALQIDAAVDAGFENIAVDARALVDEASWRDAVRRIVAEASAALSADRSVIMHTARGPGDERIADMIGSLAGAGMSREQAKHQGGRLLGQRLGLIALDILKTIPVSRLILSGGDTSSQITQILDPDALEIEARLAPGVPLCKVISHHPHLQNLQLSLKGGQMGEIDYFVTALTGNR